MNGMVTAIQQYTYRGEIASLILFLAGYAVDSGKG